MALLVRMLRQFAAYWAPLSVDQFGKPTYAAPIEIRVRWEDGQNEVLSTDGEKTLSTAKVFANLNDLAPRGVLVLGRLATVTDQANPWNNRDSLGNTLARRIIRAENLPDLKSRRFLKTYYVN